MWFYGGKLPIMAVSITCQGRLRVVRIVGELTLVFLYIPQIEVIHHA